MLFHQSKFLCGIFTVGFNNMNIGDPYELFHCVGHTKVYCKVTSLLFFRKEVDLERNLFIHIACLLVLHQGRILVMKTDVVLQIGNKLRK